MSEDYESCIKLRQILSYEIHMYMLSTDLLTYSK